MPNSTRHEPFPPGYLHYGNFSHEMDREFVCDICKQTKLGTVRSKTCDDCKRSDEYRSRKAAYHSRYYRRTRRKAA